MNAPPRISAIICTHNRADYLDRASRAWPSNHCRRNILRS